MHNGLDPSAPPAGDGIIGVGGAGTGTGGKGTGLAGRRYHPGDCLGGGEGLGTAGPLEANGDPGVGAHGAALAVGRHPGPDSGGRGTNC